MSGLVAGSLVQEMVQIIEKNVPLSWDHQCGKVHQKNCCTVHQDDTIQNHSFFFFLSFFLTCKWKFCSSYLIMFTPKNDNNIYFTQGNIFISICKQPIKHFCHAMHIMRNLLHNVLLLIIGSNYQ
jgi:hypothetical protein